MSIVANRKRDAIEGGLMMFLTVAGLGAAVWLVIVGISFKTVMLLFGYWSFVVITFWFILKCFRQARGLRDKLNLLGVACVLAANVLVVVITEAESLAAKSPKENWLLMVAFFMVVALSTTLNMIDDLLKQSPTPASADSPITRQI